MSNVHKRKQTEEKAIIGENEKINNDLCFKIFFFIDKSTVISCHFVLVQQPIKKIDIKGEIFT